MTSLLLTLMGIGLIAAMLMATISYLPAQQNITQNALSLIRTGFTGLQTGYTNYTAATGSAPTSSNWTSVLTPQYVFLPVAPSGLSWSYVSGATYGSSTGNYFCLSGTWNQAEYQAATDAAHWFSSQAYFMNSTCGATSNASAPTSWPASAAITFWVAVN